MDRILDPSGSALRLKIKWPLIAAMPLFLFFGVFYLYPMAKIIRVSFTLDGMGAQRVAATLFSERYYLKLMGFTTLQAALSTVLTLLCALPGAYVYSHFNFRGKKVLEAILALPFVLPTMVTAAAFQSLLGPRGIANRVLMSLLGLDHPLIHIDQTLGFFLLAHVFYNYVIVFRIVSNFWSRIPAEIFDAARVLGASRVKVFWRVSLPMLFPAIMAASVLVFIFCFTSFGIILILGGPQLATLEVEIYRQALHLFNLPMAAGLSMIQLVFTFVLMGVYTRMERKSALSFIPAVKGTPLPNAQKGYEKILVWGNVLFISILIVAPLLSLMINSLLTSEGFSLIYYQSLWERNTQSILYVPPIAAALNSLKTAFFAGMLALGLGFLGAVYLTDSKPNKSAFWDPLLMLPLSTSAVTLGFGFIIALDRPPLNLRTSFWLPVIAHGLIAIPFVIRTLSPVIRSIPQSLKETAHILGASAFQGWCHVDLPLIRRAIFSSFLFAFAISMGEFGATVFVARPMSPTLPLAIYRFLNHPGGLNYGQAMAMSCILMLVTLVGFIFIDRLNIWQDR